MATSQLDFNTHKISTQKIESCVNSNELQIQKDLKHKTNDKPIAIIMLGYFLGLASVAVLVVGGQFPWFIIAPATILFLVVYFRHLEATYNQKSSTS